MDNANIKRTIADTFNSLATALETGSYGKKVRIGVTTGGSEHGLDNVVNGALQSLKNSNIEIVFIGEKNIEGHENFITTCDADAHKYMESALKSGSLQACVTMHYNFPIGVSTVGRVISPANGHDIFISSTTGTSATDRNQAMFKNAIYGIIAAKSCGVKNPTVGILNLDGGRVVERALKELKSNGYDINFATSTRADGGNILRGNDIIQGSSDVVVCDSLTGNILMKMFSAFNSGGNYETVGFGYGPGIGFGFHSPVFIVSRASGSKVIAGAIEYAYQCVFGNINSILDEEEQKVKQAGFDKILESLKAKENNTQNKETKKVEREVVTAEISGIEVMDLDSAVELLMSNNIYAEAGMGCTGPIILVNTAKRDSATSVLKNGGFLA